MKVAFFSQPMDGVLPPFQNSVGISTYEMAKRISRYCDVIVYVKGEGRQKKSKIVEGVKYCSIPTYFDEKIYSLKEKLIMPKRMNPSFCLGSYYMVYAVLISLDLLLKKYDIVQVYNFSQFVPIIRFFNPKIKIVLNMRCEWLSQIDRPLIKSRLKKVDKITGCSDYITTKIKNSFPEFSHKCSTVYNGVSVDEFFVNEFANSGLDKNKPYIKLLFVGRCSPEKGVHTLLEAFKIVLVSAPNARLDIVGSKGKVPYEYIVGFHDTDSIVSELKKFYEDERSESYFLYCKKLADKLGVGEKVNFLGGQTYDKMPEIYKNADIVVNSSYSESLGRSLFEAMACGRPVIASNVGGSPEIIEDGAGLLFEAGDVSQLAEQIISCIKDEKMCRAMGTAGRKRVEEVFSWDRVFEKLYKEFEELVN